MKSNKLNLFEIEDIEDCLPMFEEVFKIKLKNEETERVKSFDEFCDLIFVKENTKYCIYSLCFPLVEPLGCLIHVSLVKLYTLEYLVPQYSQQ